MLIYLANRTTLGQLCQRRLRHHKDAQGLSLLDSARCSFGHAELSMAACACRTTIGAGDRLGVSTRARRSCHRANQALRKNSCLQKGHRELERRRERRTPTLEKSLDRYYVEGILTLLDEEGTWRFRFRNGLGVRMSR